MLLNGMGKVRLVVSEREDAATVGNKRYPIMMPALKALAIACLQRILFYHAHNCAAPKCGWCKTRKAPGPSVLEYDGDSKTICCWMQRRLAGADDEAVDLVKHFALFHEAWASG
jgi:hypothetical protein